LTFSADSLVFDLANSQQDISERSSMKPIQIAGFSNPADVVNVVDSPAVDAPAASEAVI
jgi:hypothetical protein